MKKSLLIKSLLAVSQARLTQVSSTPSTPSTPANSQPSQPPAWLEPKVLDY
jgi:hypothetical protein